MGVRSLFIFQCNPMGSSEMSVGWWREGVSGGERGGERIQKEKVGRRYYLICVKMRDVHF